MSEERDPAGEPDRRIARGNPWARAIRPDDDKARSPVLYVLFGLLSLVMVAVFVAALVLPPMFMHTLLIRGLRDDFWQKAYFKSDISVAVRGEDERWEFAVIGKNIGDRLTSSSCTASNTAAGVVGGGQITGGATRGPAGVDELSCFVERGREVWLRLTVRPFN